VETAVLTGLIGAAAGLGGALVGLGGALGSQLISARLNIRARRIELYFRAKADAYRMLMERVGEFALDPGNIGKYLAFLSAHEGALIFASDDVAEALTGRAGLGVNAQRLRAADSEKERQGVAVTTWYQAVHDASRAMRNDLKRLSGGLQ